VFGSASAENKTRHGVREHAKKKLKQRLRYQGKGMDRNIPLASRALNAMRSSGPAAILGRLPRPQLRTLLQRWVRSRKDPAAEESYIVQKSDFGIRVADMHARIDRVEMLVTRMYRQRGYETQSGTPDQEADGTNLKRVTLEACRDSRTVGTITVGLDGPDGLNAEELYAKEIVPFRERGARLCEFNRLALDVELCGKDALGYLFHLAVIFAYRIHRATDLFIEVNPRHAAFYRRKLGFAVIGEERICRRVNAPAILLHQELRSISEQVVRHGGFKIRENKSFYSFFMPPWEEKELIEEVRTMLSQTKLTTPNGTVRALPGGQPATSVG
jgi:hypothetical protein